jgi:hypothetical protein
MHGRKSGVSHEQSVELQVCHACGLAQDLQSVASLEIEAENLQEGRDSVVVNGNLPSVGWSGSEDFDNQFHGTQKVRFLVLRRGWRWGWAGELNQRKQVWDWLEFAKRSGFR